MYKYADRIRFEKWSTAAMKSIAASMGLFVLFFTVSCRPDFDTLDEDCEQQCRIVVFECDGASMDDDDQQACAAKCRSIADESERESRVCGRAYEAMMKCVGGLVTCQEIVDWSLRTASNPCDEESREYDESCAEP